MMYTLFSPVGPPDHGKRSMQNISPRFHTKPSFGLQQNWSTEALKALAICNSAIRFVTHTVQIARIGALPFPCQLETFLAGVLYREFRKFMRILKTFFGKPTEIHHNYYKRPKHPNYDGFLCVFPRKVVRIRMNSRNSLYNAPAKKSLQLE